MLRPRFPLYIPSKSRWDSRLTIKALDMIGVDYRVIVEEQQHNDYATAMGSDRHLLVLDPKFQDDYDTFDDLGQSKSLGPGPARNQAWADSMERGHDWHWVMDDNINGWWWFIRNRKVRAADAAPFVAMEDFVLRYKNVGMAGPNYTLFTPSRIGYPPFLTGTRIYSCNLIRNSLPFRWRGRYNEDTDLSLNILKAGWQTVQFNAFLQFKMTTQVVKGGNTEAFYAKEGTKAKSEMLYAMHPDVTRLSWKFGRAHHYVDYGQWRGGPLIPDPDAPPARKLAPPVIVDPRLDSPAPPGL